MSSYTLDLGPGFHNSWPMLALRARMAATHDGDPLRSVRSSQEIPRTGTLTPRRSPKKLLQTHIFHKRFEIAVTVQQFISISCHSDCEWSMQ